MLDSGLVSDVDDGDGLAARVSDGSSPCDKRGLKHDVLLHATFPRRKKLSSFVSNCAWRAARCIFAAKGP